MAGGSLASFGHFWATMAADAARPEMCFVSLPASSPHSLFAVWRPSHLSTAFKMTLIIPLVALIALATSTVPFMTMPTLPQRLYAAQMNNDASTASLTASPLSTRHSPCFSGETSATARPRMESKTRPRIFTVVYN